MKPKLLLVSAIPPFPQTSGGATRIQNTIIELSKYFEIYFITFENSNKQFLEKYCQKYFNLKLAPKTLKSPIPYHFSCWYNSELKILISNLIDKYKIPIVQIEFTQLLYLADNLPNSIFKVFTAHDISTISFYRRVSEPSKLIKKLTAIFSWLQIWYYETKYLKKFDQINTVSDVDKDLLLKMFNLSSITVPNGIKYINILNKKANKIINLGFIGSSKHPPNKYAINYIINKIFPKLEQANFQYKFVIAGDNPNITHPQITNLGIIKDPKTFYQQIDLLIAPIFSGSGSRVKILESLSYGIPVITTTIGVEGLPQIKDFIKISNNSTDFSRLITNFSIPNNHNQLKNTLDKYLWSKIFSNYSILLNQEISA